ncbi:hypothetical protein TIFTF001_011524 [Ficus carica]|uniref:Uncharacterized protein n=1 Tax=Ficus carica TaxID=3494 RepID=A0AA88A016_FICCA|nr:hypothetical protein TIFTF001_011524 [Ficus carica]
MLNDFEVERRTHRYDEESAERATPASPEKNIVPGVSRSFWKQGTVLGDGGFDPLQQRRIGGVGEENLRDQTAYNAVEGLVVPLVGPPGAGVVWLVFHFFFECRFSSSSSCSGLVAALH